MSAERSAQCVKNFGHAPGAPSKSPQTDADDGAVGQLDTVETTYHGGAD